MPSRAVLSNRKSKIKVFEDLFKQPTEVYAEGLRFFRGVGLMNKSLGRLAKDLNANKISYSVIGAVALNQHGYRRFTEDIDILLTPEGLQKFAEKLVGKGYRPAFEGAKKKFRTTAENIPIEVITSGEYPGDGKPKSVVFPDPSDSSVEIDGIQTITLEKLIELKLASGISGLGRRKDLADVQELIRVLGLDTRIIEKIDPSVHAMYLELHGEIVQAKLDEKSREH